MKISDRPLARTVRMCACLLLLCLSFTALIGCGAEQEPVDRTYTEAEVIEAAVELLPKTALVNDIFYGYGIPTSSEEDARVQGRYREADAAYLAEHGITSIEDVKTIARAAYAESFCTALFSTTLEAQYDEDVIVGYRRYFEIASTEQASYALMVDTAATVLLPDAVTYDLSSVKTDGVKGELVYITVDITVVSTEGMEQTRTIRAAMIEEEDGWRFYELTGASYSEYYDRIEE